LKTIIIIRHAKSSWQSTVLTDFDRALNNQGLKDAKLMGKVLASRKINLDMIISSTANRAITTAKIIANQIQFKDKIREEKKIYGASSKELFDIIIRLNSNINSIALVGHNPALHILSEMLSNEKFPKFPTCSVVKINFTINSWDLIQRGNLEYFLFPKSNNLFI